MRCKAHLSCNSSPESSSSSLHHNKQRVLLEAQQVLIRCTVPMRGKVLKVCAWKLDDCRNAFIAWKVHSTCVRESLKCVYMASKDRRNTFVAFKVHSTVPVWGEVWEVWTGIEILQGNIHSLQGQCLKCVHETGRLRENIHSLQGVYSGAEVWPKSSTSDHLGDRACVGPTVPV